jgi:hypothetical protein
LNKFRHMISSASDAVYQDVDVIVDPFSRSIDFTDDGDDYSRL